MITLTLIAVAATLACYYIIQFYRWKFHVDKLTSNIPVWGYSLPFIGQSYKFLGDNELIFNQFADAAKEANKHGGRIKFWLGSALLIGTTNPKDLKIINNTYMSKPFLYEFSDIFLKKGLISAQGPIWKKNIKRFHNAFSMSVIEGFNEIYNSYARQIVHNLKAESGAPPFDALTNCIALVILKATCHTVMGVKKFDNKIYDYYEAIQKVTQILILRAINPLLYKDFIYEKTRNYRKLKDNVKVLQEFSMKLIQMKIKENEDRKNLPKVECKDDVTKFRSLLDILLEQTETDPTLTIDQIQVEIDTFISAGFGTSRISTILILLMIGTYPRVQEKVYEELNKIFNGSNRDVTMEDLDKMKYCEAVIKETLRMYPIIPVVLRQADKDLDIDGSVIPKGAVVVEFLWGTGRSRNNWGEDAEEFIPERFFRETQPDPAAFATFSYGRRMCIAKNSALVFLKIILAHCGRELQFKADASKLKFEMNINIEPIGSGHYLQVSTRE